MDDIVLQVKNGQPDKPSLLNAQQNNKKQQKGNKRLQ
jgi:hypothetical protein